MERMMARADHGRSRWKEFPVTIAKLDDQIQMRDVDAILSFLPRFRDLDPIQACIRWPGIRVEDDKLIIYRGENHPLVQEFIAALYEHGFVRDYHGSAWQPKVMRYYKYPVVLKKAVLKT
jgi:hypothetical protein